MAQAESGGISFDPTEVGPDWTRLLSGTGLLIALGGGVVFFVLRSWVCPKVKPLFLAPAFSYIWPSVILALGLVTAVLESRGSLTTTAENLLVVLTVLLLPLNLLGFLGFALTSEGCHALAPNSTRFFALALGCSVFWITEFVFLCWLRVRIVNGLPVRLDIR
jgi:hypothetical protein